MEIVKQKKENELTIGLIGRLDTVTSPKLEAELQGLLSDITRLHFDFRELEYVSSAGLRVILSAQKQIGRHGVMTIGNASEVIKEIFDMTGFSNIITIL